MRPGFGCDVRGGCAVSWDWNVVEWWGSLVVNVARVGL